MSAAPRLPALVRVEGALTPEECQRICALATPSVSPAAVVRDGDGGPAIRDSAVTFLARGPETRWLFDRADDLGAAANQQWWQFEIGPLDALQVACYAPGQHYDWHVDLGVQGPTSRRKLSLTLQLSEPDAYTGGALELLDQGAPRVASRTQGDAVLFPAWVTHRVTAVTAGTRWSLVGWFKGRAPLA